MKDEGTCGGYRGSFNKFSHTMKCSLWVIAFFNLMDTYFKMVFVSFYKHLLEWEGKCAFKNDIPLGAPW